MSSRHKGSRPATLEQMRAYRPYGSARQILLAKDDELLLSGPAGTGKSRGVLEKIHICCEKYPGCRWLIVRKTRASLTESALVTFEEKVVPEGHPILQGPTRATRRNYVYPNGSEIILGGMDKPTKIMSTEYDGAYFQEAIEGSENEWESISTRLRNGVMPYQQLIGDTNPDKPTHWLLQRCNKGQTKLIECRHEDNPVYWDHEKGEYTPAGQAYIVGKLEKLTGARLQRLRYGKWVSAEGLIYEDYDAAIHVVDRYAIPPTWPRVWVVDFGFTNPFVWQAWAIDPDGRLIRYKEIYKTKTLVEDHAKAIKAATVGEPAPIKIICDHDAEDRATLEKHLGMVTIAAKKTVSDGIQAVASRLKVQPDGKPRLMLMRDSLVERDPLLTEAKKPCCTEEEIDGYVWETANGVKKGDKPVKSDDHGVDCIRYLCADQDLGNQYLHATDVKPSVHSAPVEEFNPFSTPTWL